MQILHYEQNNGACHSAKVFQLLVIWTEKAYRLNSVYASQESCLRAKPCSALHVIQLEFQARQTQTLGYTTGSIVILYLVAYTTLTLTIVLMHTASLA